MLKDLLRVRAWLASSLVVALLAACGDDDGHDVEPMDDAAVGTDGGEGDSGSGGEDAGPMMPPTDGGGMSMMPQEIMCGPDPCSAPELDFGDFLGGDGAGMLPIDPSLLGGFTAGLLQPCCTEADMACGARSDLLLGTACIEQDQQGVDSATCPDIDISIGFMGLFELPITLQGCCRTADNLCGVDLGAVGVGCMELTEANEIEFMGTVQDAGITDVVPCTPGEVPDASTEGDAGADEDAG